LLGSTAHDAFIAGALSGHSLTRHGQNMHGRDSVVLTSSAAHVLRVLAPPLSAVSSPASPPSLAMTRRVRVDALPRTPQSHGEYADHGDVMHAAVASAFPSSEDSDSIDSGILLLLPMLLLEDDALSADEPDAGTEAEDAVSFVPWSLLTFAVALLLLLLQFFLHSG
jgi:hypothetical protein